MRRTTWLGALAGLALAVLTGAQPAAADSPAQVANVAIQGDAVVGTTLTATADISGDPLPTIEYRWVRCAADGTRCNDTVGTADTYVITDADVGFTLRVNVAASNPLGTADERSAPTAVVIAAPPPPDPAPDPTPTPTPTPTPAPAPTDPPPADTTTGSTATTTTTVEPAPALSASPAPVEFVAAPVTPIPVAPVTTVLRYLRPFPVVRIRGVGVATGAWLDLVRVTAPRGTRVAVTCRGSGCPLRRMSLRPGRIRPLERFLPVGTTITIRVTRTGYIGKYVRLVIRSRAAPSRIDSCMLPGRTRPSQCPV